MKKVLVVLLIFGVIFSAYGLFEPVFVGGRYVALGGANITEVSDPYSMIYNPAGLVNIKGISASISYAEPFGVPGMNLINLNLGGNMVDVVQIGVSLLSYGADINSTAGLNYRVASLGVAREFNISDFVGFIDSVSVGASGKVLMVLLRGYELDNSINGDKFGFSADVGLNVSFLGEFLKIGVVGYNLVPYRFAFFSDSTNATDIYSSINVGTSLYLIKPYMKVFASYGIGLNSYSSSSFSVGTEISYADTIFTRIGLKDNKITMGLGVKGQGFEINFGVQNRDNLGWYYQIDLIGSINIF